LGGCDASPDTAADNGARRSAFEGCLLPVVHVGAATHQQCKRGQSQNIIFLHHSSIPSTKKLDFVDDSLAVSFRESSVTRPIKWKATHERLRLGFSTDSASDMPIIASKNGLKKLKFFLLLVSNAFFAITRCLNDRQSLKCLSPSSWPSVFTSACGGPHCFDRLRSSNSPQT
jgi:hypothetical protein